MSFNWREAAGMTRQETVAHLGNTRRADQLQDNQCLGWDTSKKPGPDVKPATQQIIEAMRKPKKIFGFWDNFPQQPAGAPLPRTEGTICFWSRVFPQSVDSHRPQDRDVSTGVFSSSPSCSITPDRPDGRQTRRHQRQEWQT